MNQASKSIENKNLIFLRALMALCLFVLMASPLAEAVELQKVRVGYFQLPGYHEVDEQGHRQGYGYDLVQRLKFYNNWECEYVGHQYKWLEGLKLLERGEVDLVTGVRMRRDRLDKFSYSNNPVGRSASVIIVRDDDARFVSGNYSTYHDIIVCALKDSIINQNFDKFAKSKGFDYKLRYYDTMAEQIKALRETKEVDAVLTSSMRFMEHERVLDQYDSEYVYAVVKKGNEELLGQVNRAIYKMDYVNPMWRQDLFSKYYTPRKGIILPLTHDEYAYKELSNAGSRRFKVLVNPDRSPYSYYEAGEYKGIFPQIMQEIARTSGLNYQFLPVKTRKEYLEALREHRADIVLDLPESNFHAERLGYNLSEPLLSATLFMVRLRGNDKQPQRLAFVRSAHDCGHRPDFLPKNAELVLLDSFEECLKGVMDGKYDATYMYAFQAQEVIAKDASQRLVMAIVPSVQLNYCLGVNANESYQLASILNKAVESVKSNYVERLLAEHATVQAKPTLWQEIINDPWAVGTIVFVVLGIAFLLGLLHVRQRNMDIITRKNEQLEEQQKLLSRALEQAEQSNRAKTVFLNSVSHDIRTPMNAIMGFAKLAEEQAVNPVTKRYLDKILLSGKNLLSLINDVLDMSSIENGKLKVHEEQCDLAELLKSIHEILQPAVKEKQLQFLLDASRIGSQQVVCDKILLQRVLLNCLSNSVKYTDAGGIVSLRAEQKGPAVADEAMFSFQISDNGIGMSKEFLERLFEPFARERDTTTSGIQGTGLGLTITKSIVELLGGKIIVESEAGKGTVVYVDVPFKLVPVAQEASRAEESANELSLEGKHVLLVDDVELNREIAQMMLEKAGCEVDCCVNGQEAVDYMSKMPKKVDFILMDLMMPVMDGLEAAKLIRRLPEQGAAGTIIIALTANALNETKQEILASGMNGMLNKPFNVEALKQVLRDILQLRK